MLKIDMRNTQACVSTYAKVLIAVIFIATNKGVILWPYSS